MDSAAAALRRLNPTTTLELLGEGLTRENAQEMVSGFDVVLDCSDNAPTRYLLSDACCRSSSIERRTKCGDSAHLRSAAIPLVSGAAIGGDGQLTVYCAGAVRGGKGGNEGKEENGDDEDEGEDENSDDDDDTPCYRCLFPVPPPAASCGSCAEAGVLGPVPGVIGVLQALEAIKLLALGSREEQKRKKKMKKKEEKEKQKSLPPAMTPLCRRMLAFDGRDARFRTVQLRPRSRSCVSCGDAAEGGGGGGEELEIKR